MGSFQSGHAASVRPDEMATARQWAAAKFEGVQEQQAPGCALEVIANTDPVQKNGRAGKPMNLAGKQYTRGLYVHAVSKVIVHLDGPARSFSSVVGLDSNEQTSGGRGSVVFVVKTGTDTLYRSGVLREGMAEVPVNVDLKGAKDFTLEVEDGADGISCDQSDWADAKVVMEDGSSLWLGEFPFLEHKAVDLTPPFSFVYGGKNSSEFLNTWDFKRQKEVLDANRIKHTLTYTDPQTNLVLKCEAVEYKDFPTVEWTLFFRNTGISDTPILSDVKGLDLSVQRETTTEYVLHHQKGTYVTAFDFEPLTTVLTPDSKQRFAPPGGRPLGHVFPYFNLQWEDQGMIAVVAWPGQWAATFERDTGKTVVIRAGQELVNTVLKPGEEIRSPLIVLQFWKGDWVRSQNIWREWMRVHNIPKVDGKIPEPIMNGCSSHQFGEMIHANEENQILFVDRYLEEKLPISYWWMDAGWYIYDPSFSAWGWPNTGTWEIDKKRFPGGFKPITDHAHSKGVKSIVWFEPERVTRGTWLYGKPEWLIDIGVPGEQKLLDLGNPEALSWLINHIDTMLKQEGIDLFRIDYNIDPLSYWRHADAENRQGITENHYVTGFLKFFDALLERNPKLLIDTCASGGHRNDLETLRRSIPLLRSDYIMEPIGQQNHTYGLSYWIPFFGTGLRTSDPYVFRSMMCPAVIACWDMRDKTIDYDPVRKLFKEWQTVAPYVLHGDFYPLTTYGSGTDVWMAWQFDRQDTKRGIVQAFRRDNSIFESARFKLKGLDADARYRVKDFDTLEEKELTGKELMDKGLLVELRNAPGSALIEYAVVR